MSYYSQFGEDKWIAENTTLPKKGIFVDVGASDGVKFSNTLYFEELGWDGVCIDANFDSYVKLLNHRQNALFCAVSTHDGLVKFFPDADPDYSRISYTGLLTPSLTLNTILKQLKYSKIDLLSLDVEGHELDVLKHFGSGIYKPKVIIIEYNTFMQPSNKVKLMRFFKGLPYKLVHETEANLIFERI